MNLFLSRSTKDVVKFFGCQENSKATVTYDERVKESESNEEFKPSTGWLKRFMKREGLSLQQKTSVAQKDPDQLIDKLVSFFTRLPSCHKTSYGAADIIGMDETHGLGRYALCYNTELHK